MKRIILLFLLMFSIILFASCSNEEVSTTTVANPSTTIEPKEPTPSSSSENQSTTVVKKTNYFDYNGKLHVEGNHIMNQYNEPFQLNGVNCPIATNCHELWRNLDKFDLLKEWGFNFIRFGLSVARDYTPEVMETYYGVLDHLIELGMYAEVISFNDNTQISNTEGMAKSKEFLGMVAEKYKDYDNFIYCVGNEPGEGITMPMIDEYAKEVMSEVFKYKKDAIIAVPTPYACSEIDDCAYSTIDYKDTIYVVHCYLSPRTPLAGIYRRIKTALAFNKCLYFSEWSASSPSASDQYFNADLANNTAYIINTYKLPNAYYNYFPGGDTLEDTFSINMMGMVKNYWWNDRYREEGALTQGGKFAIGNVQNPILTLKGVDEELSYTMINEGLNQQFYFWNKEKYSTKIKTVTFTTLHEMPSNMVEVWNISETGLGELYAYVKSNGDMYDLVIMADKTINFPQKSSYLFNKFSSCESIVFNNIDTSKATTMKGMFTGCSSLKTLDVSAFTTSNVEDMHTMFANMQSLEELDISNFDTSKVKNTGYMFFNNGTKTINMKNCVFTAVEVSEYMFAGCNPTKVIVSSNATKDFILDKKRLNIEVDEA